MSAVPVQRLQAIVDASGVAERIELMLPVGVRPRQLRASTLLIGMLAALYDHRPAHLRRVHEALIALSEAEKWRLGVLATWKDGPHLLTYRQLERTFGLMVDKLAKEKPDGSPSAALSEVIDALLEASVQALGAPESSSLAVDWTDLESFSRPPRKRRADPEGAEGLSGHDAEQQRDEHCADPEASWGHRRGDAPGQKDELFFGYYLQAATIVREEAGPEVPELVRRIQITSCHVDPPAAFVPVLARMVKDAIAVNDILADSGYAYRHHSSWALPLRRLGAQLIQDSHPNDRGVNGTHMGAICCNGNLYCPATPQALLELSPPARAAGEQELAAHDGMTQELARYKLGKITGYDHDGYHRVSCPAVQGKLRCELRPSSMELPHTRPQVLSAPEHPPACCSQQTLTVPTTVNAKTAGKHDYPSTAHRLSYNRRSAAERTFATVKDPASNDISRGWCRLMGLTPMALFTACLFIVRNTRVTDAFQAREAEQARRLTCGLPPRKRRRRRRDTLHELLAEPGALPARPPPP